jgi:hypothetical protein
MSTNEPPADQPAGPADQGPPPPTYGAGYGQTPPPPPPAPPGGGGYSVGTAWSYGWSKFAANIGQILIAVVVLVAIWIVIEVLAVWMRDTYVLSWVFSVASWVVSMIIGAGVVRGALDITEGRRFESSTVFTPRKLGDVIIVSLLIGIATFIGFVLCVIPGLLVMFFTSYTLYFLMDREELGAIDAIRASFEFTKSNAGNVILWFLLSLATWIVGALLCGVGLIVAVPVVLIGTAYTYKALNHEPIAP